MRFRKLRIAWSVFWGVACVLLIVLWVRSNKWCVVCIGPNLGEYTVAVNSMPGFFILRFAGEYEHTWGMLEEKVDVWEMKTGPDPWSRTWGTFGLDNGAAAVPYWLAALLAATLTAAHWIRWRFSLR